MSGRRKTPINDAIFHITTARDKAGLELKYVDSFKGRGVFAVRGFSGGELVRGFSGGELVLEVRGDLISSEETQRRLRVYHRALRGFIFTFTWHGKLCTIDAATDDGTLGRLVNDNHINPNCKLKRITVDGRPRLCLFALRDIATGEEITYKYGDGDCPWRSKMTGSGMDADNDHLESNGALKDDQHCIQHSQHRSISGIQVTRCGIGADGNHMESDGAFGDDQRCNQHLQYRSASGIQVTKCGTAADSNDLESDCAPGDDQHYTQHSQQESTFCNKDAKCGTAADSNGLESDCEPGDDQH